MTTYEEEVRHSFSLMGTDELLERLGSGHLTEEARAIALAELKARGVDPANPESTEQSGDADAKRDEAALHEPIGGRTGGAVIRWLFLIALIGIIPTVGYLAGRYVQTDFDGQWLEVVRAQLGAKGEEAVRSGRLTLDRYCASAEGSNESACDTYQMVLLLQDVSIWALIAGVVLILAIMAGARFASANRNLLVTIFSPGIKLVLALLFVLIIVQGAIAIYSLYLLEATILNRVHFYIIAAIGIGAVIGAFTMIKAGMSVSRRANSTVVGKSVTREEQPQIWDFISGLARKLGAQAPQHLVIGLEPNFYVTSADVIVVPGQTVHREETLYLSLSLMRILSQEELTAVIGHELGHFRGDDTRFSMRFYPIYAGATQALAAMHRSVHEGIRGLVLLPAFAVLSLFLREFAKAERAIGREREYEADKAGASVASARAIATSLLKIGAFTPLWSSIRAAVIKALNQGKAYKNVSTFYAEAAASSAKPELIDQIASQATAHPTDTHPPTGQRIEALGLSVSSLRDDALQVDLNSSSALLLDKVTELEEFLTEVEHRVLLDLGYAALPDSITHAVDASDDPRRSTVTEPLGLCPNCERPIPVASLECSYCKAQFSEGSSWKIKPMVNR